MWSWYQIFPDTMKPVTKLQAILLAFIILSCMCIPVSAYSSNATGWYDQGTALIKNKSYNDAVGAFDHAVSSEPSFFEAWNGKADALNRAGNFTEALAASDRVIVLNPDYVQGWINRGYILYNLGRYDEELNAYENATRIDPKSAAAWFNRGYSLAGLKRYDEAIIAFDKVKELDPAFPNLEANRHIAEQNRDATTSFNASEKTRLTTPTQSQITTSSTLKSGIGTPSMPSTTSTIPETTQSPVSVGAVIGIFSMLVIARQIGKRKKW
jgi:tetratricopeptide (TPR) repeat protein